MALVASPAGTQYSNTLSTNVAQASIDIPPPAIAWAKNPIASGENAFINYGAPSPDAYSSFTRICVDIASDGAFQNIVRTVKTGIFQSGSSVNVGMFTVGTWYARAYWGD
jgi:hypothetical protein